MSSKVLTKLFNNHQVWQAKLQPRQRPAVSTGYIALDKALHYAGWPQAAVSELLVPYAGVGELRLIMPFLAHLSLQSGYVTWINPPFIPYPVALAQHGLKLKRQVLIKTSNWTDTIWSAQQALCSGACAAVITWLPNQTSQHALRKLSLAAKTGNCWGFTIRASEQQQQASPASLRLNLRAHKQLTQINVIKQPGGWSGQQVSLNLFPERRHYTALSAIHWPSYQAKCNHPQAETQSALSFPSEKTYLTEPKTDLHRFH
ncbi:translesion DNA synthesis-associated protein ImuA [Aliikangiella sp. IMCC44653]